MDIVATAVSSTGEKRQSDQVRHKRNGNRDATNPHGQGRYRHSNVPDNVRWFDCGGPHFRGFTRCPAKRGDNHPQQQWSNDQVQHGSRIDKVDAMIAATDPDEFTLPSVKVTIAGKEERMLIDSGSPLDLINKAMLPKGLSFIY